MNQQPKYRIYATLLDAFGAYLNSDVIWDKYWEENEGKIAEQLKREMEGGCLHEGEVCPGLKVMLK